MGVFSRLGDIVNANINSVLEKAENPEKMIRLIIQEMEDTLVELRSSAAKCIADKNERLRKLTRLEEEQQNCADKAELALRKEREDLARAALGEKADVAQRIESINEEIETLEQQLARFNEDIGRLQAKLNDAKQRQRTLVMREKNATTQLKARQSLHNDKIEDLLFRFESAERRVENIESRGEALDMGRDGHDGRTVADEIDDLSNDDRVDAELEQLKARVRGGGRETQGND